MPPRVLFVSKPIAAPFHDGSKCLVRDVARHLTRVEATVMATPGAAPLQAVPGMQAVRMVAAYGAPGGFTPAFSANLRAAAWLLLRSHADIWHFVFAPNPRTSSAGRFLRRLRGVPVVQTIASPPRSFEQPERLFFGDVLVAQSSWTKSSIVASYEGQGLRAPEVHVIPPPVPDLAPMTAERLATARQSLGLAPGAPYLLYPGDLETSSGAEATASMVEHSLDSLPQLTTVFAYRKKSARAVEVATRLAARLPADRTRFVANASDILALVSGAVAVVFPVDDLWGKVDLPIVLLEAMALGTPVFVLDRGPLCDLGGVVKVPDLSPNAWLSEITPLLSERARAADLAARQHTALSMYQPGTIARAYEELYLALAHRAQ